MDTPIQSTQQNQPPRRGFAAGMSKRKFWLVIVSLLAVIVLTGGALIYSQTLGQAPTQTQSEDAQIIITPSGFEPTTIQAKKGQSVTWINQDTKPHQLTSDSQNGATIKSEEPLNQGDEYSVSFEEAGEYAYYDPQNPSNFKGTVVVE